MGCLHFRPPFFLFLGTTGLLLSTRLLPAEALPLTGDACQSIISKELRQEIRGYQKVATEIIDTIISGAFKGRTHENLTLFVDKFGPRPSGSKNLERSIDYLVEKMKQDGLENVQEEPVNVPNWIRGEERAMLVSPREKQLKILGLGHTVPTPPEGITAPALVVKSFEELTARSAEAKGSIVVFNQPYGPDYMTSAQYRKKGAVEAAKVGAVACLVRSITPFSIYSPHTGTVLYPANATKIPAAAMAVEDAEFLYRMQSRGEKLTITLILNDKMEPQTTSRNAMGDLGGKTEPQKVIIVGCHIDSWDVGMGAMDDATGCLLALEALNALNHLKLRPKRTLRAVLFTAEEMGLYGANQYVEKHEAELDMINLIMEADFGTFLPLSLDVAGAEGLVCIAKEVTALLSAINSTTIAQYNPMMGTDTAAFTRRGIPGITLGSREDKYMSFHHTEGDTISVENPDEVDISLAVWTVTAYVLADLKGDLPRK